MEVEEEKQESESANEARYRGVFDWTAEKERELRRSVRLAHKKSIQHMMHTPLLHGAIDIYNIVFIPLCVT